MKTNTLSILALTGLAALTGCSFHARGPDSYRQAVRNVLDTKSTQVDDCYKRAHEQNAEAKGTVVVHFWVEPKTGDITNPEVIKERTTADETLQKCVLDTLPGLKLDPADQRKGDATFAWNFSG